MLNSIYFTPKRVKKQPTVCKKSRKKGKYGWLEKRAGLAAAGTKTAKMGAKNAQKRLFSTPETKNHGPTTQILCRIATLQTLRVALY